MTKITPQPDPEPETRVLDDRIGEPPPDLPSNSLSSYDPGKSLLTFLDITQDTDDWGRQSEANVLPPRDPAVSIESGGFVLVKQVGRGGFGEVYKGVQSRLNRIVAVKQLRREILDEARGRGPEVTKAVSDDFRREGILAANLEHPNIMPVHDLAAGENDAPIMAMKYIRGKPWDRIIGDDFGELSAEDFLAKHIPILIDVAQAVAFAHSRGVVHRDLKPAQVLIGDFGEVILTDWGLAVVFDRGRLQEHSGPIPENLLPALETAKSPAGTPAYMAPEQAAGTATDIGPWTDVYLLGGILYQLLTGRLPHQSESTGKAFRMAALGEVMAIPAAAQGRMVPGELAILAANSLKPEIRYRLSSASEFAAELKDWLTGTRRHHDSRELTREAASALAEAGGNYEHLSEVANKVHRADRLWGENPETAGLLNEVHSKWCRAAIDAGDFLLARMQAKQILDPHEREELLAVVSSGEGKRRRQEAQRRVAAIGFVVVLVMLLFGGAWFTYRLSVEKHATQQALERAIEAQEREEDARRPGLE